MSGGSVGEAIRADDSSTITVLGTGFAVDGVSVSFGPIAAMSGTLTGTLESGEPIDSYFCHSGCEDFGQPHTGLIALVPEPDAALLFPVAVLSLAAVRRLRAS